MIVLSLALAASAPITTAEPAPRPARVAATAVAPSVRRGARADSAAPSRIAALEQAVRALPADDERGDSPGGVSGM